MRTAATETTRPPVQPPGLNRVVRVAPATLERGRFSWFWVVSHCPFCGQCHDHYAGPIDGDPRTYAGRAVAARCSHTDRRQFGHSHASASPWYIIQPQESRSS
jgi:hypothetical protein